MNEQQEQVIRKAIRQLQDLENMTQDKMTEIWVANIVHELRALLKDDALQTIRILHDVKE